MKDKETPMPFDVAQEAMRKSLLNSGMTWTEARNAIKTNPRLQQVLKELRKECKDAADKKD